MPTPAEKPRLKRTPRVQPVSPEPRYGCLGLLLLPIGLYWLIRRRP